MQYNRPLTVYTTNTRRANVYQSAPQDIGQFFGCAAPRRSCSTMTLTRPSLRASRTI